MKGKDMSGVLFKNERATSDKHPVYKGRATINGEMYWMSAWVNENEKGKYLSIRFEVPEDKPSRKDNGGVSDMRDDLPF